MTGYRLLTKGEIVQPTDEYLKDDVSPAVWVPVAHSVGKPAPDPQFTAHRKFRRAVSEASK